MVSDNTESDVCVLQLSTKAVAETTDRKTAALSR